MNVNYMIAKNNEQIALINKLNDENELNKITLEESRKTIAELQKAIEIAMRDTRLAGYKLENEKTKYRNLEKENEALTRKINAFENEKVKVRDLARENEALKRKTNALKTPESMLYT